MSRQLARSRRCASCPTWDSPGTSFKQKMEAAVCRGHHKPPLEKSTQSHGHSEGRVTAWTSPEGALRVPPREVSTHLLVGGAGRGCKQHVGNSSLIPRHFSKRVAPGEVKKRSCIELTDFLFKTIKLLIRHTGRWCCLFKQRVLDITSEAHFHPKLCRD